MASKASGQKVSNGLKSVEFFARVRFLLALWDLGVTDIKKGEVLKRTKKTGEKSTDYDSIILQLEKDGAIACSGSKISLLLPTGLQILSAGLQSPEFTFSANVGAKTVNALLNWIRQLETSTAPATAAATPAAIDKITSYEAFKPVALEVFDRLNRDYNMGNMVPIYRIRRDIGDQVSRSQFSEWLFQMQSEDLLELLEESVEDGASDKIEDSVTTKLGKPRCYARQV